MWWPISSSHMAQPLASTPRGALRMPSGPSSLPVGAARFPLGAVGVLPRTAPRVVRPAGGAACNSKHTFDKMTPVYIGCGGTIGLCCIRACAMMASRAYKCWLARCIGSQEQFVSVCPGWSGRSSDLTLTC